MLECVAEQDEDPIGVERLFEDVVRAKLGGLHCRLDRRVPGDHDHERSRIAPANLLQRLEPVHARHLHVEKDEVRLPLADRIERLVGARHGAHFVPLELEELAKRGPYALFIIHHQNAAAHGATL